jgi:hypothetical protein
MLLGWLSPGQTCSSSRKQKDSKSTGCCPIIQGCCVCWSQCLVPDLTSLHVWNIQKRCVFILFHLRLFSSRCIGCFRFPWFHVWHFTFHIPFRCFGTSLLFQHYTESQLLKPRLWLTHTHKHAGTHASTPTHLVHTHKHKHTQTYTHTHTHIFPLILHSYLVYLVPIPLCMYILMKC